MKSTKVSRLEFLTALENVEPGLSPREALEQSSCYVFTGGRVMTFNGEVYCRCPSGLPNDFEAAVQGRLLEAVRKLPDDEVTIENSNAELCVGGKRDKVFVNLQHEVLLPVDKVEKPIKGRWKPVESEFAEGMKLVSESCGRNEQDFKNSCVHMTPNFIESTNNWTFARFKLKTGLKDDTLIRVGTARAIASRGPTEQSETGNWLHYKNGSGVYVSGLRYMEDEYHELDFFTKYKGRPTTFPKAIVQAAERLEVFSKEDSDNNFITVSIGRGRLKMTSQGVSGRATHTTKVKYDGKPLEFHMGPEVLSKLVETYSSVEVCNDDVHGIDRTMLIVHSGRLFFLAISKNMDDEKETAKEKAE